jgi:uncharacterized membrane protein
LIKWNKGSKLTINKWEEIKMQELEFKLKKYHPEEIRLWRLHNMAASCNVTLNDAIELAKKLKIEIIGMK